jgi:cholesterol oxidase
MTLMPQPFARYDAVIIGSGFGGAIAALRLAETGKSTLVLERGRRYSPHQFPRDIRNVDALFWEYPRRPRSRGLFDLRFLSGTAVLTASGVGGGSLIYAGIHIRPDPCVFEDRRWPASIDRAVLDPYYERVAEMLHVRPIPPELSLPKRDAFREAAGQLGREVFDPDQAIAWADPAGEDRQACQLVAECEFGCRFGAKHTADLTYLAAAEQGGAIVRAAPAPGRARRGAGRGRCRCRRPGPSGRRR